MGNAFSENMEGALPIKRFSNDNRVWKFYKRIDKEVEYDSKRKIVR